MLKRIISNVVLKGNGIKILTCNKFIIEKDFVFFLDFIYFSFKERNSSKKINTLIKQNIISFLLNFFRDAMLDLDQHCWNLKNLTIFKILIFYFLFKFF